MQNGRDFTDADNANSPAVAIVDQALVRQYWASDGEAIGKRIRTLSPTWYTIVGVVSSVKDMGLSVDPMPHFYMASGQAFFAYGGAGRKFYLNVNANNPTSVVPLIRDRVNALDPEMPIHSISTLRELLDRTLNSQSLVNLLITAFSIIALVLATVGTYGVMSVSLNSRAPEFAIRQALGASPRSLLATILKQALVLAAIGIVFGLAGSWALMRMLSNQLFEVSTTDPIVFAITPVVLVVAALLASYLPARRASRTDPAVVLRNS